MYITLKSIKRNLGLFNLELEDIILGGILVLLSAFLFLLKLYTFGIIVVISTFLLLIPVDFSKCGRVYKLLILFIKYLLKNKSYFYYK